MSNRPSARPNEFLDNRLPLPKPGDNVRLPESAKEARKTLSEPDFAEKARQLSYTAGIPLKAAEIIITALAKRDARIAALEQRVAVLERGCDCPEGNERG